MRNAVSPARGRVAPPPPSVRPGGGPGGRSRRRPARPAPRPTSPTTGVPTAARCRRRGLGDHASQVPSRPPAIGGALEPRTSPRFSDTASTATTTCEGEAWAPARPGGRCVRRRRVGHEGADGLHGDIPSRHHPGRVIREAPPAAAAFFGADRRPRRGRTRSGWSAPPACPGGGRAPIAQRLDVGHPHEEGEVEPAGREGEVVEAGELLQLGRASAACCSTFTRMRAARASPGGRGRRRR